MNKRSLLAGYVSRRLCVIYCYRRMTKTTTKTQKEKNPTTMTTAKDAINRVYVSICLMPLHSYNHCFQFPKCAHFTRNAKCKVVFIEAIRSCWIIVASKKPSISIKIDLPSFFFRCSKFGRAKSKARTTQTENQIAHKKMKYRRYGTCSSCGASI